MRSQYDVDDVKARSNIVQEIEAAKVSLKKRGATWWGCCPFHAEKTPSFTVNPDKDGGVWHCFGCGIGGDVIGFVQKVYRLDFSEALTYLGDRYGARPVERSAAPSNGHTRASIAEHQRRKEIEQQERDAEEQAQKREWWKRQIANGILSGLLPFSDSPASVYLSGRGISPAFPLMSKVRYAPLWGWMKEDKDDPDYIPFKTQHPAVIFPLYDDCGNLVAVNGKFIPPFNKPKDNTVGNKSLGVFSTPNGLSQRELVVAEGPIDALSLAVCGIPAIACCGTAYPHWLVDFSRSKQVYAAFDFDTPGENAARKLCEDIKRPITRLWPCGAKDWNELLQILGIEETKKALAAAGFPTLTAKGTR